MIGSGLKKLAKEHGMTISDGIAYGSFQGYTATLSEGMGFKLLAISTRLSAADRDYLEADLEKHQLLKEFRIEEIQLLEDAVVVTFRDNPGTMKKIQTFVDHFFPLLRNTSATGADICPHCGQPLMGGGTWRLVGNIALHIHEGCAQSMLEQIRHEEELHKEADNGSYASGFVGALLGALVGSIVWAVVLYIGYMAGIVGLLIGYLAEKGYGMLHGKNGKPKILILLLAALVGIFVGTLGADGIFLALMIRDGGLPGVSYLNIPSLLITVLLTDSKYLSTELLNMGMGVFFALLGMSSVLAKVNKETSSVQVKELR